MTKRTKRLYYGVCKCPRYNNGNKVQGNSSYEF